MKIMSYLRSTIKTSVDLSGIFLKSNRKILLMDIFLGVSRETQKLMVVIFPAIVMQLCFDSKRNDVILIIGMMAVLTALVGIGVETIQRHLSDYSLHTTNTLYYKLNRKNAQLDLKDVEESERIDEYYNCFDNIYQFSDVHYNIFCQLLSKSISFGIMSVIIGGIDWRLYVLVAAVNVMNLIINSKQDSIDHEYEEQIAQNTKRIKYLKELMYDFEAEREIRMYHAGKRVSEMYRKEALKNHTIELRKEKTDFIFDILQGLIEVITFLFIYLIAIGKFRGGIIQLASFVMYINAVRQMSGSFTDIMNAISFLHKASFYYQDFDNYLGIPEDLRNTGTVSADIAEAVPLIEFKNVSFQYPNQDCYALRNISFRVYAGETISVVGDNGAGKSTLVKLLLRLYDPTEGVILYNGTDIRSYDYDSYQEIYGVVFQDYVMNAYTLRENLIFNHINKSKYIEDALKKTDMYEKVMALGLDRPYSKRFYEDGVELSGGEEQRLAISRAYCKNTKVMICDEPTAAIDPLSEYKLFKDIYGAVKGKTNLFISHRMSSAKFSTRILVLDQAELVGMGTHEELMHNNSVYSAMFCQQSQYYL